MGDYDAAKIVHSDVIKRANAADTALPPLTAQYLEASKPPSSPAKGGQVEIHSKGQIESMTFPKGWTEGVTEPYKGIGNRSYNEVQLAGDKDVAVSFFYRGFPLKDDKQAQAFHDALSKPAHTLTAAELQSMKEVLGDKANPADFNMLSARTEALNGKNVLVVEGRYKQLQQDAYHVYVDSDGSGKNVQEMFYQAPKEKYFAHMKEAKAAFNSIEWKK